MFPHFAELPPATPAQAAAIYKLLAVSPKALHFDQLNSTLAIVADLYVLLLIWLLLATRLSSHVRDIAARWFSRGLFAQAVATYLLISAALAIAGLPLSVVRGWIVLNDYGLSNQTLPQWLWDHMKAVGINACVGALVAGILILLIKRSPRRWPYLFAMALAPVIAFGIFVEPLVVEPMFNHFSLLPKSNPLYTPLHELADRAGINRAAIYVVDKSKQTNETNAYVTGIGSSARIVLWDTTLKQMPPNEIIAITGHEMGHYVEGHLYIGFTLTVIGLFIAFPVIRWLATRALSRFGERWHVRSLHDPAALPLLLLCLQLVFLITQPISNQISREIEHRADAYSLDLVRDRVSLARSFVDLSKENLDNPYPPTWEKFWFDDHPPTGERVTFALYGQP